MMPRTKAGELSGPCRTRRGLRVSTRPRRGLCTHTTGTCHFPPCGSCLWVQGDALSREDVHWGCRRSPLGLALVMA